MVYSVLKQIIVLPHVMVNLQRLLMSVQATVIVLLMKLANVLVDSLERTAKQLHLTLVVTQAETQAVTQAEIQAEIQVVKVLLVSPCHLLPLLSVVVKVNVLLKTLANVMKVGLESNALSKVKELLLARPVIWIPQHVLHIQPALTAQRE